MLKRRLGDESGFALVFALMIIVIISVSLALVTAALMQESNTTRVSVSRAHLQDTSDAIDGALVALAQPASLPLDATAGPDQLVFANPLPTATAPNGTCHKIWIDPNTSPDLVVQASASITWPTVTCAASVWSPGVSLLTSSALADVTVVNTSAQPLFTYYSGPDKRDTQLSAGYFNTAQSVDINLWLQRTNLVGGSFGTIVHMAFGGVVGYRALADNAVSGSDLAGNSVGLAQLTPDAIQSVGRIALVSGDHANYGTTQSGDLGNWRNNGSNNYASMITATNSLLAYWRLNEPAVGSGMADSSGNGRNGTYSGAVTLGVAGPLVNDAANTAATFTSTSTYAQAPDLPAYATSSMTVEGWVKATSTVGWQKIVSKGIDANEMFALWINPTTHSLEVHAMINNAGTSAQRLTDASVVIDNNVWHYVAGRYDASTGQLCAQVDNTAPVCSNYPGTLTANSNRWGIGEEIDTTAFPLAGSADEIAVYGSALSNAQLLGHYVAGASNGTSAAFATAITGTSPLSYWHFDELSGTSAADSVGSNTGTYNAGVTVGASGALNDPADKAISLSGTATGYVQNAASAITGPFTIETWAYLTGPGSAGAADYSTIAGLDGGHRILMVNTAGTYPVGTLLVQDGVSLASANPLTLNAWHQIVLTYDGSVLRFYTDGVANGVSATTTLPTWSGAWKWGSYDNTNYMFKGKLDEGAIYNTALSAAQISAQYTVATASVPSAVSSSPFTFTPVNWADYCVPGRTLQARAVYTLAAPVGSSTSPSVGARLYGFTAVTPMPLSRATDLTGGTAAFAINTADRMLSPGQTKEAVSDWTQIDNGTCTSAPSLWYQIQTRTDTVGPYSVPQVALEYGYATSAGGVTGRAPQWDGSSPLAPSGTPLINQQLDAAATTLALPGSWISSPAPTFAYVWQRYTIATGWQTIAGATASTYTLTSADSGYAIRVQVTATNPNGSTTLSSAQTGTVAGVLYSYVGATPSIAPNGDHVFTFYGSGSFTVTAGSANAQVLVVGGGGGGGNGYSDRTGGGGGAGGLLANNSFSLAPGTYSVTVGSGGGSDVNGTGSSFGSISVLGGGHGGHGPQAGGSGGGGAHNEPYGGMGTSGQGSNGGSGWDSGYVCNGFIAGGGGGAVAAGTSAYSNASVPSGGSGLVSSITGTAVAYAGGGGGGTQCGGNTGGYGGTGGGGNGSTNGSAPTAAAANTGGGGGGGGNGTYGAAGGSGIVIIRFP